MKARAWLLGLVLNAAVAALATWATLTWWNRTHPCPAVPTPAGQAGAPARASTAAPAATPAFPYVVQPGDTWDALARRFGLPATALQTYNGLPADAPLRPGQVLQVPGTPAPTPTADPARLEIVAIVGAGALPDEHVRLRYTGTRPLALAGWTLEDTDGHRFAFPDMVLYPDSVLQVWTKTGTATVDALYWGLSQPVWTSGEEAVLRTPDGAVAARYRVP